MLNVYLLATLTIGGVVSSLTMTSIITESLDQQGRFNDLKIDSERLNIKILVGVFFQTPAPFLVARIHKRITHIRVVTKEHSNFQ